jgi:SAM-dependent methyltransferase
MPANFDAYAKDYSERVREAMAIHGGHDVFIEAKARYLIEIAERQFGRTSELSVLDVGCGVGLIERYLAPHFRKLCGVDIAVEAIREAKQTSPEAVFLEYDGVALPFRDDEFDVVFAVCVLHHVPAEGWPALMAEMLRVVRPGGIVAVFEHNPLNPVVRIIVSRCEFDRDAVLLGAGTAKRLFDRVGLRSVESRYILFFPWRARVWRAIERALFWLPFGAQYCVFGQKEIG